MSHDTIHEHEEMGEKAMWVMYAMGAFALLSVVLIRKKHALANMITIITLLISFVAFGMMMRTGQSGGHIRHTEIQH